MQDTTDLVGHREMSGYVFTGRNEKQDGDDQNDPQTTTGGRLRPLPVHS